MNTRYEFLSAPPLVMETNGLEERMYWVNDGKRYTPMAAHALSHFARRKGLEASQMKYDSWISDTRVRDVRCIAELQPGLWRDRFRSQDALFLNPAFVSFRKLPIAPEPPEGFVKLRERRTALRKEEETSKQDRHRRFEISQELEELTELLIEIFEKERGVKRLRFGSRWNHPWRLLRMTDQHVGFPCDRQAHLYQGKGRLIWVSQPAPTDWDYSDPWDEDRVVGFAHLHGLAPTLSPNWSWRWPGQTALLEWQKR